MEKLYPRWKEATNELIEQLEKRNVKLNNLKTLEIFGRKGDWQTTIFYKKVKMLEVWEINQEYEIDLKKNLPNATIKIQDSIDVLEKYHDLPKFDLILIDNPMNIFGSVNEKTKNKGYCEHFDTMKNIQKLIKSEAIIIFNVNRKPFDYNNNPSWKLRRNEFYKIENTENMSIKFLLNFYKEFFQQLGFQIEFCFNIIRVLYKNQDMTHYFAYKIKKIVN